MRLRLSCSLAFPDSGVCRAAIGPRRGTIHQPTYPRTHAPTHPSVHSSIHPSIYPSSGTTPRVPDFRCAHGPRRCCYCCCRPWRFWEGGLYALHTIRNRLPVAWPGKSGDLLLCIYTVGNWLSGRKAQRCCVEGAAGAHQCAGDRQVGRLVFN